MHKAQRHDLILELISSREITRQDDLADALRDRGLVVTQASISRDLDELGIIKIGGVYKLVDVAASPTSPFGISAVDPAGENLVVVKCSSGLASAVAVRIDAERFDEIVGTIAGDDTIFIAVKDSSSLRTVSKKLRTLFAGG